jgi:hypothetical protein
MDDIFYGVSPTRSIYSLMACLEWIGVFTRAQELSQFLMLCNIGRTLNSSFPDELAKAETAFLLKVS